MNKKCLHVSTKWKLLESLMRKTILAAAGIAGYVISILHHLSRIG